MESNIIFDSNIKKKINGTNLKEEELDEYYDHVV